MKKYKYLLCILLFMICPNFVNAQTCSNSEKVKYQEMAKNIDISYDYYEFNTNISYSIKLTNIQPGMTIKDVYNNKYYNNVTELNVNNFVEGKSYRFDVYFEKCDDDVLYSKYVTLPYYNKYYGSDLCVGIEEFKYCQKWTKTIDYKLLEKLTNEYRKTIVQDKIVIDEEKKMFDKIINFYLETYFIILPLFIIISIIVIINYNKKNSLF